MNSFVCRIAEDRLPWQWIMTLIVFVIWPMSILGWSIAQRAFRLAVVDSNPTLG